MSPDRLFRHTDPPDEAVVRWGPLRDVAEQVAKQEAKRAEAWAARFRSWATVMAVGVLIGIAIGVTALAITLHTLGNQEDALCVIARYGDEQAQRITEQATPGPEGDGLRQRAGELRQLAAGMRDQGVDCD